MPPKKLILQKKKDVPETTTPTPTIIKVTKVDENKQTIKPKLSIIKSKQPIIEPTIIEPVVKSTIEDIEEESDETEEDDEADKDKEDEDDEDEVEDKDLEVEAYIDEKEEDIDEKEEDVDEKEDEEDEDIDTVKILSNKPIKPIKPNKPNKTNKVEKQKVVKSKDTDTTDNKIHNHSKPKTIIASTKIVNTVDMFGDDDLDFRYVMMNYDYTKNVTMPKITKYERALLIGKRAKQIEEGANPNVKYISGQSVISIAEEELRQRKIPLIIKRPIGNKFEYWKPVDMEVNMD